MVSRKSLSLFWFMISKFHDVTPSIELKYKIRCKFEKYSKFLINPTVELWIGSNQLKFLLSYSEKKYVTEIYTHIFRLCYPFQFDFIFK